MTCDLEGKSHLSHLSHMTGNACCGLPDDRHFCHDTMYGKGARKYGSLDELRAHIVSRKHVDPRHEISSVTEPRSKGAPFAFDNDDDDDDNNNIDDDDDDDGVDDDDGDDDVSRHPVTASTASAKLRGKVRACTR